MTKLVKINADQYGDRSKMVVTVAVASKLTGKRQSCINQAIYDGRLVPYAQAGQGGYAYNRLNNNEVEVGQLEIWLETRTYPRIKKSTEKSIKVTTKRIKRKAA